MKILVLNWQDITNPLAGGAEVHLHEVFERIAARGHSVTLFCHAFRGAPAEEVRNGIRIIRRGNRMLFNFTLLIQYLRRFRKEDFDIVVDDVNKIPFYTPLFAGKPVQVVTHHLFGKSIFLEAFFPFAAYVYLAERLIKPIYRHNHFIIGSPSTRDEYIKWGFPENQISVINYCVNHSVYYPDNSNSYKNYLIGYFGRLKKYKCADHLLQAFTRLKEEYPELRLKIIGDGDDRPRLELLARELGIGTRVEFLGFVREEEKAPILQEMNFVVNTSSKEGWGLTVVEANACGAPVIAANVQGLRDSVLDEKTGLLYEFGNVDELTAKIRYLLDHPERRNALREQAIHWAKSFDWERAADETLRIIERTIAGYSARRSGKG